ncbi:hypothetical protein [Stakelama tenebrarum]|uniref:DUF736 domain-containing protein n=1 Tax=Stakelama tenebrarum TaxID=2711215 RepID=A0A6G6Y4W5_9SPHN|nr:hypothetical protein [Sphingosinithalassobacter tenebrarum]QIG79450.1 hypothetical protein G5C33_06390 [Sphingosinithalassobacter tenebrarum]QIG79939.1 hypothetical protein G5C33_09225 [Sphingosinithalassobacter tenebrarum]
MTTQTENNRPTHRIYAVNGNGDDAIWTPVAAAWANRDGKGFTLKFEAIPVTGRIVMREISSKEAENQGALA